MLYYWVPDADEQRMENQPAFQAGFRLTAAAARKVLRHRERSRNGEASIDLRHPVAARTRLGLACFQRESLEHRDCAKRSWRSCGAYAMAGHRREAGNHAGTYAAARGHGTRPRYHSTRRAPVRLLKRWYPGRRQSMTYCDQHAARNADLLFCR